MLYLEDFLDLIESLPLEMREKLTDVRELDLQVQNGLDCLGERSKHFFKQCAEAKISGQPRTDEYQKILSEYDDLLHVADDKVQLANNLYGIVQRFVTKLDQELLKFKMELEADNAGITEVLERKSKELDSSGSHRNDRRSVVSDSRQSSSYVNHQHQFSFNHSLEMDTNFDLNSVNYGMDYANSIDNIGSSALSSAVSQQNHNNHQNHHINSGGGLAALLSSGHPNSPGVDSEDLSSAAPSSISGDRKRSRPGQSRRSSNAANSRGGGRKNRRGGGSSSYMLPMPLDIGNSNSPASVSSESLFGSIMDSNHAPGIVVDRPSQSRRPSQPGRHSSSQNAAAADDDDDGEEDGGEMKWCLCNDVSYGEMIMCDNKDCPIEWFHYACVHISSAPKGRWYCPQCTAAMKRRGAGPSVVGFGPSSTAPPPSRT